MTAITDIAGLAARIPSGAKLALPADYGGVSNALTGEILRAGVRDLHLVCVPTGGLQVDILIGAGRVATLETSAVSLGEAGAAPCFGRAARVGSLRILDATCPAILAGLAAAQKGVPFMPLRGLIGSDVLRFRADWQVIANPFDPDDPIVVVPAIQPDLCLFHAAEADRDGNVRVGRRQELALMAHASRETLVTVETISETSLLDDERAAAGVLPGLYVSAVAEAPRGAAPYGLWGGYPADAEAIARYAKAARTLDGFEAYLRAELEGAAVA